MAYIGCASNGHGEHRPVDSNNPYQKGTKEWMAYEEKVCGGSDFLSTIQQGSCPDYHKIHNNELSVEKLRYEASPEGQAAKAKQLEEAREALNFVYNFQKWEKDMYNSMSPEQQSEVQRQRYQSEIDDYNSNQRSRCYSACGIQGGRSYSGCIASCNLIR